MRGLKIIIDGVANFLPYNRQTIALYEERNNILSKTPNGGQREIATILEATQEEVQKYLLADVVPSTAGVHTQASATPDIATLMSLLLTQQQELSEMKKQLAATNTPALLEEHKEKKLPAKKEPKTVIETPAAPVIDLDKSIPPTGDDLQDFS